MLHAPVVSLALGLLLAACNPFQPEAGFDYKECETTLKKLPRYTELSGGDRLAFIDTCMAEKNLRPTEKCVAAGAQGKPHCEYQAR